MRSLRLWLRWSWRDLRANWIKVAAIALVIAIGTGAYAGLSSSANWRRLSNDASFGALNMYDLRVELSTGSLTGQSTLAGIAAGIEHAAWIDAAEERLITPTQIDASTGGETIVVPGSVVGVNLATGPSVNGFHTETGRALSPADAAAPVVLLEHNFARFHELPASGSITVSGGTTLGYVGQALTPEYFVVAPEGQLFFSEANYAGVFTSLETAQQLAGAPGMVNDLVLRLVGDADREIVESELEAAFDGAGIGFEVTTRDDDTAFGLLTRDVDNDQQFFNVFALLIFAGAVGAAFNLINRLAEQQRREIGIAMSLGVLPRRIAIRPLLVGAQIALLGIVFGVGIGVLIGNAMRSVFVDFLPLPEWRTPFQVTVFWRAALLGFLVPFIATIIPIRRAVRVSPREAIAPAYRTAKGGWLSRKVRHFDFPGNTFAELPMRNLTRNPRRTVLTVLGIAAAVTVLVALLGVVDSFIKTIDRGEAETLGTTPGRAEIDLNGYYALDGPEMGAIQSAATVDTIEPTLRVGSILVTETESFAVLLEFISLDGGIWQPTISEGTVDGTPGLVLTEAAAADLGVGVGDHVAVRHPVYRGDDTLGFAQTELPVLATHPYPMRPVTYMDIRHTDIMGFDGLVNRAFAEPAPGTTDGEMRRELFSLDSIAAVQPAAQNVQLVRDSLDQILGVLQVVAAFALLLALLIAFNSASIALEARTRDHATMFAFGVRVRTALRMAVVESFVVGLLATIVGVAAGIGVVWWSLNSLMADTMPDFAPDLYLNPATLATVAVLGIVVVALAPVFTVRRMRRMDLPGTLRLME